MKYLIAFDKFKGAITAPEAVKIAAGVISKTEPESTVFEAPLTDGGEGFASIIGNALGGKLLEAAVPGPRFDEVMGRFSLVDGDRIPDGAWRLLGFDDSIRACKIAFVEMASASGYECLDEHQRDPWGTSTIGTGFLLKAAVDSGAAALVLGIGGSATNDCGAGALEALGVCYYDRELQEVTRITPSRFREVNTLGSTSHMLESFPPVRIACDVTNPLLGPDGATRVFGPQKGLKPDDTDLMERNMRKMGTRILGLFGVTPQDWDEQLAEPGAGAAGGIGFALRHALPDSAFVEGFPLVSEILDIPNKVIEADTIITGEGRFDKSSLSGKGPNGLIKMAGSSKKIWLLTGSLEAEALESVLKANPAVDAQALSKPRWPLQEALEKTPETLARAVRDRLKVTT